MERVGLWANLWRAFANAARGKRGHAPAATFEFDLADNLPALQTELQNQPCQPGPYHSFYIHEPKKRLISAAPFRNRVVHHALCQATVPHFEKRFYAHTVTPIAWAKARARRYRYVLPGDIVQFFPAIDHARLRDPSPGRFHGGVQFQGPSHARFASFHTSSNSSNVIGEAPACSPAFPSWPFVKKKRRCALHNAVLTFHNSGNNTTSSILRR